MTPRRRRWNLERLAKQKQAEEAELAKARKKAGG
jgi:hypothetical protein